jgi:hypothetical protein
VDDLVGLAIGTAVAILPAAIPLVQETLVVALHLVVEDDALDAVTLLSYASLGSLVGAVDLDIVVELARLPEVGVELLAGLVCSLVARKGSIGFEQVPASVGEDDGAVVGLEWRPPNQTLVFEVTDALVRLPGEPTVASIRPSEPSIS